MQVFMGQAWGHQGPDFRERALRAERITFADLGVVRREGERWVVEHASVEASAFVAAMKRMAA